MQKSLKGNTEKAKTERMLGIPDRERSKAHIRPLASGKFKE